MIRLPRSLPIALAAVLVAGLAASTDPALATDPNVPPSDPTRPTSPPTIHAEMARRMAAADARGPRAFVPGAMPERLEPVAGASAAGLPNGLAREVLGYLPYWAVTAELLSSMDYDRLSTIAYFGLAARSDGTLTKSGTTWNAWSSAAMTDVINAAHAEGVEVVLTVTMMAWDGNYAPMSTLLNSSPLRVKLANEIAAAVSARNADGVNLDFEPMPNSLQSAYTAFVRDVRTALGADRSLTVAVTGGSATWDEGYDLAGLTAAGAADAIMVMGYDLNWSGSAYAGGVAPIDSPHALDVRTAMDDFVTAVPPSRLIWGVPYYGRAWTTTSASLNGRTCISAGTCTAASWAFAYADAVVAAATHGRRWDAGGQVPWYTYWSSTYGAQVQSYYDDATSLDAKYDLVTAHDLRGVGIWHLLMDAGHRELWDTIARNLLALPFSDIDDSPHWAAIVWLEAQGITNGCGGGRFCPTRPVRRDEMASFLVRAFELPPAAGDHFTDDDGNVHESSINALAAAGITGGCATGRYCPSAAVRRDEMAAFLQRALAP